MEKEEKNESYHGSGHKFKEGNLGGPGGKRIGAGRPPKPEDSLLKKLYAILEKSSEQALKLLKEQLKNKDDKVAQGAAKVILSKVLPERSAHESWQTREHMTPEEHSEIGKLLIWKREQDLKESGNKEREATEEEEKKLKLVKREGEIYR